MKRKKKKKKSQTLGKDRIIPPTVKKSSYESFRFLGKSIMNIPQYEDKKKSNLNYDEVLNDTF